MATAAERAIMGRLDKIEDRIVSLEDTNVNEAARTRRRINVAVAFVTALVAAVASGLTAGLVHH